MGKMSQRSLQFNQRDEKKPVQYKGDTEIGLEGLFLNGVIQGGTLLGLELDPLASDLDHLLFVGIQSCLPSSLIW